MGIQKDFSSSKDKMKLLMIVALVLLASATGQGPEGGEGTDYQPPQAEDGSGGFGYAASPSLEGNSFFALCECIDPPVTYSCGWGRTCGNCQSRYKGRLWCYVGYWAAASCGDTKVSGSGKLWSFNACYYDAPY